MFSLGERFDFLFVSFFWFFEEINKKIISLENIGKAEPKPKKDKTKKEGKKPKKSKAAKEKSPEPEPTAKPPETPSTPTTPPAEPATSPTTPQTPSSEPDPAEPDYSGIPQPLSEVSGDDEAIAASTPDKAPGAVRTAEQGPYNTLHKRSR